MASFGLGIASGLVIMLILVGGSRMLHPAPQNARGGFGAGGPPNAQMLTRMATRLGMSEADLQKELDAGKTMQQIAQEHGVPMGGGFGGRRGNGSGATASAPSSGAPAPSSAASSSHS